MLHARGLTKTFRRGKEVVEAVKGIDFDVSKGELVAFLGPNGAGKSTTLRMLTSLLMPAAGTVEVAGWDVVKHPRQVRARIGYIGQGNGAGHSYRVLDELHNQGRFYQLPAAEYRRRATDLIEALDLGGLEKRTVQSLSGGQRRRLDVAMGLMNHPSLLFLDEPTTGLDPQSRANLWEHISTMRKEFDMTLVLTTHYLDEADQMAERVIIIDHGQIIADATPDTLKRDHADDLITLSVESDAVSEAGIADALRDVVGQLEVTVRDNNTALVQLSTDDGPQWLPRAIESLRVASLPVVSADVKQASLDDVFLNLTGRSLREDAAAGIGQDGGTSAATASEGAAA